MRFPIFPDHYRLLTDIAEVHYTPVTLIGNFWYLLALLALRFSVLFIAQKQPIHVLSFVLFWSQNTCYRFTNTTKLGLTYWICIFSWLNRGFSSSFKSLRTYNLPLHCFIPDDYIKRSHVIINHPHILLMWFLIFSTNYLASRYLAFGITWTPQYLAHVLNHTFVKYRVDK